MLNIKPLFIMGQSGKLFASYYQPLNHKPTKSILHIPAFAEEMNKSRRMVALQAYEMTKHGYAVLVLDLFGTGDSEGDFSEATWDIWKQDLHTAYSWLQNQDIQKIDLWGLRIGSLLAMDFIASSTLKIKQLLCWQPVLQGDIFVMQLLRMRIAAAMMDRNMQQEKTSDLKQRIINGETLEIAGYGLNPALIKPLIALSANQLNLSSLHKISILEMANSAETTISPALTKFASAQQSHGKTIDTKTVIGSPFWSTQEITEVPDLLTETIASLS